MRTAKTDQTGQMPRLIWVFTGSIYHFAGFVMKRLISCNASFFEMHFRFQLLLCIMHQSFVTMPHPPPAENSGNFDFSSSKSLLEAPNCGDKQLVKPLLFVPALLYLTALLNFLLFWCKNKIPVLWGQHKGENPAQFPHYPPPHPRGGQGGGGMVTNDWCII